MFTVTTSTIDERGRLRPTGSILTSTLEGARDAAFERIRSASSTVDVASIRDDYDRSAGLITRHEGAFAGHPIAWAAASWPIGPSGTYKVTVSTRVHQFAEIAA